MRIGVERGRKTRAKLKVGICGEHGGDPASVAFCHELGLDYVSCSPFRVPIARLAAAQAALGKDAGEPGLTVTGSVLRLVIRARSRSSRDRLACASRHADSGDEEPHQTPACDYEFRARAFSAPGMTADKSC